MSSVSDTFSGYSSDDSIENIIIRATNLVVLDADFNSYGRNVLLLAPTWYVGRDVLFNLRGRDEEGYTTKAGQSGIHGISGQLGENGEHGGHFYGIGANIKKISEDVKVSIDVSGGNWGKGQDGGDGEDGEDGADAHLLENANDPSNLQRAEISMKEYAEDVIVDHDSNILECMWRTDVKIHKKWKVLGTPFTAVGVGVQWLNKKVAREGAASYMHQMQEKILYEEKGQVGEKGGNAGVGGIGGLGNLAGAVKLDVSSFNSDIQVINRDGEIGQSGKNGIPGQGGLSGKSYRKIYNVGIQRWEGGAFCGEEYQQIVYDVKGDTEFSKREGRPDVRRDAAQMKEKVRIRSERGQQQMENYDTVYKHIYTKAVQDVSE